MHDIREQMRALAKKAQELHRYERKAHLESCKLIAQLESLNASVNLGYTKEAFAEAIGLSVDVYWKRAQAGRAMQHFPKIEAMVKAGELQLSHVNIIAPRLTQANADVLLERVKGKTTREVQFAAASVTPHGEIIAQEPEVELRLVFKQSELEKLEHAIDVLSSHGKVPSKVEALVAGLEALLDKRDPRRKAERAAARQERLTKDRDETPDRRQQTGEILNRHKEQSCTVPDRDQEGKKDVHGQVPDRRQNERRYIPAEVKYEVYRRDAGRCTFVDYQGRRCGEQRMLELDHRQMKCRGGNESVDNLTLRCRYHNQALAKEMLGRTELVPSP